MEWAAARRAQEALSSSMALGSNTGVAATLAAAGFAFGAAFFGGGVVASCAQAVRTTGEIAITDNKNAAPYSLRYIFIDCLRQLNSISCCKKIMGSSRNRTFCSRWAAQF